MEHKVGGDSFVKAIDVFDLDLRHREVVSRIQNSLHNKPNPGLRAGHEMIMTRRGTRGVRNANSFQHFLTGLPDEGMIV